MATFTNHITVGYTPAEPFFTGGASADLVPNVFPVAINGRPYMLDIKSGQYARGFEQRVRDSVDQSTAPGEAAINSGGLWRRGEASWHLGAGQGRGDTADSQDYRFDESKGINPWTKGELSLLNATKIPTGLSSTNTNLSLLQVDGWTYWADGTTLKLTQDPFASTPSVTSLTSANGAPASKAIRGLATDGNRVFILYADSGIYSTVIGTTTGATAIVAHYAAQGTVVQFDCIDYVKGFIMAGHVGDADGDPASHVHLVPAAPDATEHTDLFEHPNPLFQWVGFAAGQNAIYAAGHVASRTLIYKFTIKDDGTLNVPIVALELPHREVVSSIYGYLGFILIGTNKGVRYCTTDSAANLVAGPLIPTTTDVLDFSADGQYVWFTWTNYDGISTGLGRLDLANFIGPNTPAHATDLMYGTAASPVTGAVQAVSAKDGKRLFTVSGVGLLVEDVDNLVPSGYLVTGTYQWGIPDRKFIATVDTRSRQLVGTIIPSVAFDGGDWQNLTGQIVPLSYESTSAPPQTKFIEARFKFTLNRDTTVTSDGPTMTRWMCRAYAAPARSEVFRVPVLIHSVINRWGTDYYFNVDDELEALRSLIYDPRIINYQENSDKYSVIVEEVDFQQHDVVDRSNVYEGTAIVTMRSV